MPPRLAIVNPASGSGRTERRWTQIVDALRDRGVDLEVELTTGPCDALRIAREFVTTGGRQLVVLGGDGTLNEVVGGCVAETGDRMLAHGIEIAVVHQGTGGDLARGLGIPKELPHAIAVAAEGDLRTTDVGVAGFLDPAGDRALRGWISCCNVGMGSEVVRRVTTRYKRLGDTAGFALGTIATLLGNSPRPVRLRLGGGELVDVEITDVTAANNRYMGGGMFVAPTAELDDGMLDVVVVTSAPRRTLLRAFPRIYRGTHVDHPIVRIHRTSELDVESLAEPQGVVLDGELVGTTPARFWLLHRSISFRVPRGTAAPAGQDAPAV